MSVDTVSATGPRPEEYTGGSAAQTAKRLFQATRPKFFPASVLPVLAGTAWGAHVAGQFDIGIFCLALLATTCVHAGSNVLNDVGDDANGTDPQNDERIYPYTGGSRFIQTGIMDATAMIRLGIGLLAIAAIAGLILLLLKGPMILLFGLTGVALGILYSIGPLQLSSIGLGEFTVAIAFGVLPITGAAWLQSGIVNPAVLIYSIPISAWVAAILLINEVPDIKADGASGKRTLPVRLGNAGTASLYVAVHLIAVAAVVQLTVMRLVPLATPLLPIILMLPALKATAGIKRGVQDRDKLTRCIESTLAIHTLGSLWLSGCVLYMFWWPN
jgi:1,4-dihydroxy-2-naphthoate octaprenyltransferase